MKLEFDPETKPKKNPFNKPFLVDTTDDLIKEHYVHYRAPLELSIKSADDSQKLGRMIILHTKSKGIFEKVDLARFEQLSERNRKRLYGECLSVRERCDQWFAKDPDAKILVMGDINDGAGMDYYERRFSRSAVEILMGDLWQPDCILRHVLPKPKIGPYGWKPFTSRFVDRLTEYEVDVLIDHFLVSKNVSFEDGMVWNPYLDQDSPSKKDLVLGIKAELKKASDHYPVSAVVEL